MGDYADLLDDGASDKQRAGLNLRFGIEANPDAAARSTQLAQRYGLPPGVIDEFKPDYETRAKVEDSLAGLEQAPKLRGWLAADMNNARVAHDDLDNMGALEAGLRYLTSAPTAPRGGALTDVAKAARGLASGVPSFGAGAYGAAASPFEMLGLDTIGGFLRDQSKSASRAADSVSGVDPDAGLAERGFMSGMRSAGQNLAMLPVGLANATRMTGEQAMLGLMGVITGGQSYAKGREAGLNPYQATAYGIEDGTAEIVTEKYLGAAGFLKNVKASASAGKLFMYEVSKEVPGEMAATLWQNFNQWTHLNPNKSVGDFLAEQPAALAETAIATLVGGSVQIGAVKGAQRLMGQEQKDDSAAQRAEAHAKVLEQVIKTAEASKLLERSPETLRAYMQELADEGTPNIYLDSAKLVEAGVDLQALAQTVPSIAAQLDQVESGGDLVVPTGELLTGAIGNEYAQALVDNARTDVTGMSRIEAQSYMQEKGNDIQAEVERVMAQRENDAEFKAGRDQVQAQILTQLTELKRFTAQVNERYAELAASFYAVMAARTGMTVQQFADVYRLGFSAKESAGAQVMDQYDQAGKLVTDTPAFKKWFGDSNMLDEQGQPMVLYHGTNKNFTTFKASKSGLIGPGVYLGLDAEAASLYDGDGKGGEHLMPVYVRGKYISHADWSQRVQDAGGNWDAARKTAEAEGVAGVRDDHYENALNVWNPANIKSVFNRGTFDNSGNIMNQSTAEVDYADPKLGISRVLLELGKLDSLYQYPKSQALDVRDIGAAKGLTVSEVDRNSADPEVWMLANTTPDESATTHSWIVTLPTGKHATLTNDGGRVHINVSAVGEGNGGSAVYDLAANYAFNNGLKFVGDPLGVSAAAMRRRLENMLSAAIKYGSTDFLEPHPSQLEGNAEIGVPPLKWTDGDTLGNIRAMVDVSVAATEHANPNATSLFHFDPATQSFVDGDGRVQSNAELSEMLGFDGRAAGAGQAGRTTLQRAAIFNSLLSGADARRSVLESIHREQGEPGAGLGGATQGTFYQQARGQIAFGSDITLTRSIISLLSNADLSSFVHESGHFFLEVQADLASRIATRVAQGEQISEGERSIMDDMNKTLAWMGVQSTPEMSALDHWASLTTDQKRPYHEQWARGFEAYAFEGKAPSLDLQHAFQTFRAWLVNVYRNLLKSVTANKGDVAGALKVELSDEVRAVMDRMLATSDQIAEAEAARSMGPLFQSAEQAGMTLEEFKAYHDRGTQATMDAVDELQARGLRDMQWLNNARSRKLKELQKQHDALRVQIGREVRAEVMSQPIYRAWAFLTSRSVDKVAGEKPSGNAKGLNPEVDNLFTAIAKLGGLDRAEVKRLWGINEKEALESGVFGAPVVRKTGGLSVDAMGDRLMEEGYLLPDEHGKFSPEKFEALFDDQRRGTDRYSIKRDMAAAYGDAPLNLPDMPEAGAGKLRTQVLRDMYGTADGAVWRKLSELRMTSDEIGLHPDLVAELFGFTSGDELVKKLAEAEPPKSVIEGMTDTRMLQEHGDLATPAGLERAADAAIHNDARARFVATELRALQKSMAVREQVPGQKSTVDVLTRAAREYAAATIARLKVRDIRPKQYAAAEVRSAKAAAKASGDLAQAALHKRNQLINLYATKAAYAAQDEVKAAVAYFKRFDTPSKTLDPEYSQQIEALLERFDLRASTSLKTLDRRASLVEWVQSQVEQGMEPDIPPELLQEANRKSFKDMTVEEVRGLRDTVKQIEHLGRLKNRLLTSQANREFQAVVDEMTASIYAHGKGRHADTRTPNTILGEKLVGLKNFWASHIKAATWARVMDGGKDGGPVWEYLIRTANHAGDTEVAMREKATKDLAKLVAPVLKEGRLGGAGEFFPTINRSLNKEARLAIALNVGNASNLQRLLGGESWSLEQIQPVLNSLSATDWQFVQAVWDHFESYRPAIAAKETRVYGREPAWVEPTPVHTPYGELRGGYYPIKYDPRASARAESHADAEAAKQQLAGAYTSATTRRSFTKARVEEVTGRPLLYSMDGIYNGVQEVIHDLTWHEWLIDANKLVKNKHIAEAMRSKYGPDAHQQFKKWLEDNATGDRGAQAAGEKALAYIRQGVSVSGLGLNVMSAMMQPLGITQSIVRIGPKWVGRGLAKAIGSPLDTVEEINGKSEFMRTRALTRLREIAEVRSQVKGRTQVRAGIDASAYFLMMRAQQLVDVPTWWGAYEKAISEGNDEARAVALSDQAVIDAQGSGGTKDQSAIERGGPGIKLFTTFYSFFNTALNLGAQRTMNAESKARLWADYILLYSAPAILGALLKDAMTPGDSGDWDEEKILKKLIGEQLSFLMGLMFGVREVTGAVQAATGTAQYTTDYSGPAGVRLIADLAKLGKQIHQGEMDDGLRKAMINVAGELLRLPSAQINRTVTGINALNEGKTTNYGALLTGYQEPH